jgi:YD repeat-containing protein
MLSSQKQTSWTKFDYDEQGNLSKAEDSNGKAVLLVYDRTGQITKMVDANITADKKKTINRSLAFKYNAMGKPTEIALDKAGKINVDYDNFGEIKNVKSSGSNEMTYQVTEAFTNLLEIVKPAGVDLSL